MAHSFYAGMGGFVFDISGSPFSQAAHTKPLLEPYIPGDCCQSTLTAEGILFLVSSGYVLPSISKKAIHDRSKADGLAKTLVCLQAGYMIIQCATRVAGKLPLSLLEINTLGHVFCALVMYSFWLHKPQDIHTSTHFSDEEFRPVCAYMYMVSSISRAFDGSKREFSKLKYEKAVTTSFTVSQTLHPDLNSDSFVLLPPQEESASSAITIEENETLDEANVGPVTSKAHPMTRDDFIILPSQEAPASTVSTIKENETLDGTNIGPRSAQIHPMTRAERKEINYKKPSTLKKLP
jgi:hypothetical protein